MFFLSVSCQTTTQEVPLPYFNSADFTPEWLDENLQQYTKRHQISDFAFTNQNGETITAKTFENRIYVADFFFTTCKGICPKMTKNLGLVQDAFRNDDDIMLLSHTVTPEVDTPEVLAEYAENQGAINGKWHFATGEKKDIYHIARQFYFADETIGLQRDETDFLHTENFLLIDKNRHIRGVYNGTATFDMQRLIEDIRTLKKEK